MLRAPCLGDKLLLNTIEGIFEHRAHQCRFGAECGEARSGKELFWKHVAAHSNHVRFASFRKRKKQGRPQSHRLGVGIQIPATCVIFQPDLPLSFWIKPMLTREGLLSNIGRFKKNYSVSITQSCAVDFHAVRVLDHRAERDGIF
jgi:hypothetical protein